MQKFFSLFAALLFAGSMFAATEMSCAEAREAALGGSTAEVTVYGYVTEIVESWQSKYNNVSFWMADEEDGGKVFEAFRVVCNSEEEAPVVGDYVAVTGKLTTYTKNDNVTPEIEAGGSFEILSGGGSGEDDDEHPYDEDSDFIHDFASYTLDYEYLEEYGSVYVEAEEDNLYVILDVVLPEDAEDLVPGVYPIDDSGEYPYGTVTAGFDAGDIYGFQASFAGTTDGEYIEQVWWIVEGSVTIDEDLNISVVGKNSLGRAIKINLAGDGKQAVDNVHEDAQTTKFIENGQVFIRKGNKTFNVLGAQVK